MGFLQNKLMKKSLRELDEIVRAPELSVELVPTPRELHADFRKYSDNLLRISMYDSMAVFLVYEKSSMGDTYTYGITTKSSSGWSLELADCVHTPIGVTANYEEGLAVLVEAASAIAFLAIARGDIEDDLDEEDLEGFTSLLQQKYGLGTDSTYRWAVVSVIRSLGERIPSIAVAAALTN